MSAGPCVTREATLGGNRAFSVLRFLGLLLFLALSSCQTLPRFTVEPLPRYDALFQQPSGWTGGDGAYSAALESKRFLWLFGDTLIGKIEDDRRVIAAMVPNSIAVQTGDDPESASVDFFPVGGSAPFLQFAGAPGWFWPYHALRTSEGLYFFLLQLERADIPPPFGFKLVSAWLGHVSNPAEAPPEWVFSLKKIPWANARRNFGSFVFVKDGYCYVYGTVAETKEGRTSRSMILARAPVGRIADFNSWLFYREGGWVGEVDRAERICEDVASEFSVSFQLSLNQYVLLYTERPFSGRSNSTVIRLSPSFAGPWSDPIEINRCPEAQQDPRICCYAAKGHPEIASSPEELIFTYVANSCDGDLKVLTDARLYRPRFFRIHFGDPGR